MPARDALRSTTHALLAATAIAFAGSADARSIRVDPGGGSWEQNFGNVFDDPGDTGEVTLPFEFFGRSTLFITRFGALSAAPYNGSFTAPYLAPLILPNDPAEVLVSFDWGGRDRDCAVDPGLCGPDGERQNYDAPINDTVPIDTDGTVFAGDAFRVTWSQAQNENAQVSTFQVALWRLLNGDFVIEYNYGLLQWGVDGSSVAFGLTDPPDPATTFSVLSDDYDANYINLFDCIHDDTDCAPGDNFVWPGFPPGAELDAFLADAFGDPISGRAIYYIRAGDGTTVPEPGSLALLLIGGAGLAAFRRRRAR